MAEPLIHQNQIQSAVFPRNATTAETSTGSAKVLDANLSRQGRLIFANLGTNNIFICPLGNAASATGGGSVLIVPGQTFTIEPQVTCGFNAISPDGTSYLTIWEF